MTTEQLYTRTWGEKNERPIPKKYRDAARDWLKLSADDVVLELGSNQGQLLDYLRQYSPRTVGSDVNLQALLAARTPNTVGASATALPIADATIDKSISLHTLEHIPRLDLVFQELDRVTRKGGLTFHAFPAALVRGLDGALVSGFRETWNPWKAFMIARQLHVHNLNPERLLPFYAHTNWRLLRGEKIYVPAEFGSAWFVLLEKRGE